MGKLIYIAVGLAIEKVFGRILLGLGIGFATFKGLDALIKSSLDKIEPLLSGLPANVLNILALSGFVEALSVICSAYITAVLLTSAKTFISRSK